MLFRSRISARLSDLKKNQAWLAEQMSLSNESISKWINGKADPKLSNLRKVAGILKCSVGYLAGDEENRSVAEVIRIMNTLHANGKDSVLSGVIAVAASLPKVEERKTA